eukprot:CAMPEP_0183334942 /NCGR_PEP_ID=MMETSP0164_2-20130417/3389_1 /TAXON_ID=221442 /ORGANISM="Coccolithus pelagicus ssp braarudi, Strain PLY182g" /LENGTH=180 /DNA_ID=CAMNT_0025504193 /DNA_START=254 /DNA_END=796 /DNA_ORIENTATION=+
MREQTAVLCTKSPTKSKFVTSRPIFTDQIKAHRTAPRLPPRRANRANPGAHSCHDRGLRWHPSPLSPPTLTHLEPISLLDAPDTHNTPDPTRDRARDCGRDPPVATGWQRPPIQLAPRSARDQLEIGSRRVAEHAPPARARREIVSRCVLAHAPRHELGSISAQARAPGLDAPSEIGGRC